MTNKTYDTIKTIALLIMPALTFFAALVDVWGIPYGEQIVATLAALDTFAGAVVAILAANYHKQGNENGGGSDG